MKVKYKRGGNFEVEFNEYFEEIKDLTEYITSKNKFINPDGISDKVNDVYRELTNLPGSIKSSILIDIIIKAFKFKFKRPNNIEFWLERGYGIDEFNNYNSIDGDIILKVTPDNLNTFKYNEFTFETKGHPDCNLCGSKLSIRPTIGRYEITGCENDKCETNHNLEVTSIRQLGFLPLSMIKDNNTRVNVGYKNSKEFWLLAGYSYEESIVEAEAIRVKLRDETINSFEYFKVLTDLSDEDITNKVRTNTPLCQEYWINLGFTDIEATDKISELQCNNSNKLQELRNEFPERYSVIIETQLGYWLNKGYGEKEATEILSKRQGTFSKEICIEKYGEVEGMNRFLGRQKKWLGNYTYNNFSMISQELFWAILNTSEYDIIVDNIYFATFNNGVKDDSGSNNEYRLQLSDSFILPDFFDITLNKIIEFDGTYYHRNTPENSLREDKRDKMIIDGGYEVLHINESEYKKDKQKVINKCIDFLSNN